MLAFIGGISFTVLIAANIYLGYYLGKKNKRVSSEITEEEQEAIKEIKKREQGFDNIMKYDYTTALKGVRNEYN